jgi:hypothetical protein
MKFSPLPCHPVPLSPKYSPQHPILKNTLNLRSSLNMRVERRLGVFDSYFRRYKTVRRFVWEHCRIYRTVCICWQTTENCKSLHHSLKLLWDVPNTFTILTCPKNLHWNTQRHSAAVLNQQC